MNLAKLEAITDDILKRPTYNAICRCRYEIGNAKWEVTRKQRDLLKIDKPTKPGDPNYDWDTDPDAKRKDLARLVERLRVWELVLKELEHRHYGKQKPRVPTRLTELEITGSTIHYYDGPPPKLEGGYPDHNVLARCGEVIPYFSTIGKEFPSNVFEDHPEEYCRRCFVPKSMKGKR